MFKPELIVSESILEKNKHGDLITVAKDIAGKKAFGARFLTETGRYWTKYFPSKTGAKRALKVQRTPQFGG
jgi:hypothetical protein